jgi:G3E family GTPase
LPQDNHGHHHHSEILHEHTEQFHKIHPLQIDLPQLTDSQTAKLDEWIRMVLWESKLPTVPGAKEQSEKLEVLRTKGFFTTSSESFVIQGVRELYEITSLESSGKDGSSLAGKLVLIGKGLDQEVKDNFNGYVGI